MSFIDYKKLFWMRKFNAIFSFGDDIFIATKAIEPLSIIKVASEFV